jgi:hypothetical protein
MAIARIGPVVFPDDRQSGGFGAADEKLWTMLVNRISRATQNIETESKRFTF